MTEHTTDDLHAAHIAHLRSLLAEQLRRAVPAYYINGDPIIRAGVMIDTLNGLG